MPDSGNTELGRNCAPSVAPLKVNRWRNGCNVPWSASSRRGRYLPQSLLGTAMDYTLGQWPTLEAFLENGKIELDNNLIENPFTRLRSAKKNLLLLDDDDAGERSAVLYTAIESCRRGIDPYAYLKDVLTRLPPMTNHQVREITPAAWPKAHWQVQRQLAS